MKFLQTTEDQNQKDILSFLKQYLELENDFTCCPIQFNGEYGITYSVKSGTRHYKLHFGGGNLFISLERCTDVEKKEGEYDHQRDDLGYRIAEQVTKGRNIAWVEDQQDKYSLEDFKRILKKKINKKYFDKFIDEYTRRLHQYQDERRILLEELNSRYVDLLSSPLTKKIVSDIIENTGELS